MSSHLHQTNLVNKEFFIWFGIITARNPKGERWHHLARSDGQSQCRSYFILPTYRVSHIILKHYFMQPCSLLILTYFCSFNYS